MCESGGWLNDKHMKAAQDLLKRQFPGVSGLQPTIYGQTGQWDIMAGEGVQILNESNSHWLCMSSIGCPSDEVAIYDSRLKKSKVHPQIIRQIASLYPTSGPLLKLRVMSSQGQSGGSDCGLFAIATATSLCHGIPPSTVLWEQKRMRAHLIECLESGKMTPFPGRDLHQQQEAILTTVNTIIYCSCRMPQLGMDKMAQCIVC